MVIRTGGKLGDVEVLISVDSFSAVDSYIRDGYSITLDRPLTYSELDQLDETYAGEIQEYAYLHGSRNHN